MAASGFEGFEKRLELQFSGTEPFTGFGLRLITYDSLVEILKPVQCTVVSAVGNRFFDSYVLSESSLFVYPTKIIIKTCGITQLLKSLCPLLSHASNLNLAVSSCRYTRGSFIFPKSQPFPHTDFDNEVAYLESILPSTLSYKKASVLPSCFAYHSWHVFEAIDERVVMNEGTDPDDTYTIEVCMTELDLDLGSKFHRGQGDGKEITEVTGIDNVIPGSIICDFAFDPCGYSMNGILNDRYSTIHVAPEAGHSYASFECIGSFRDDVDDVGSVITKVLNVFRPSKMSVSCTAFNNVATTRICDALKRAGMCFRSHYNEEFHSGRSIAFQMFAGVRSGNDDHHGRFIGREGSKLTEK